MPEYNVPMELQKKGKTICGAFVQKSVKVLSQQIRPKIGIGFFKVISVFVRIKKVIICLNSTDYCGSCYYNAKFVCGSNC